MSNTTQEQFDGQAALTAVRELAKTLVERNVISAFEAQEVFTRAARLHQEAAVADVVPTSNSLAAEALLQCAAEIKACQGI